MSSHVAAKPDHWTDEQWKAITERGQNLLVAAAAGSGKTSVLVERIIRRILDPQEAVGVDQLLVVTFTNAAAAEMRHRIGDALRKALEAEPASAHLRRQLALLPRATITTIHSFCLGLLRQHYHAVELDPDFRIADEMEAELLRQDVLEAKLEEWYESNQDFHKLADSMLDGQDDAALVGLLLRLYDFSRSHPQPNQWLMEAANMFDIEDGTPLSKLPWTKCLLDTIALELKGIEAKLRKALQLADSPHGPNAYAPLLASEVEALRRAVEAAQAGWEELQLLIKSISFGRLPAVKDVDLQVKEQVQELRKAAKDKIKKLHEGYFLTEPSEYLRDLQKTAPYMKTLASLVIEFAEAYRQAKQERSLVDFGDLEHMALQILVSRENGHSAPSVVARQLREQFAEVLVDEYQDINLVQETVLAMVSRDETSALPPNRFMVGDVKQSIYRFRLAEPRLFLHKYQGYSNHPADRDADTADGEKGLRIDLAANFRSRREVVDAVNFLFRIVMSPGVGEISYDQSAELIGRASYPEIEPEQLDVEVHLINRAADNDEQAEGTDESESDTAMQPSAEEAGAAQLEARLIARRIRRWMEPGEGGKPLLVYDKKTGGMRPLQYSDIVILLRATAGWAQPMKEEFKKAGIPVYVEQSEGYFSAVEVDVMLSLLRVIDNPQQDIPLAAVLRSPLVGIQEEQLAQVRIFTPAGPFYQAVQRFIAESDTEDTRLLGKLRYFLTRLQEWRTRARQDSLASLIAQIYRDTGYADYVASLENGAQRQANLRALYDRARQYEAASYRGLFRFLRFVDRLQEQERDLGEARTVGESEEVVRIMTIHKSKGLEFPVVFVAGMGKQFNKADVRSKFILHKDLGFGPHVTDTELGVQIPSLAHLGIKQQLIREMLAEEMRVLYVALTRAREKLLLVGSVKDLVKSVESWCDQIWSEGVLADEDVILAKGYLDWIGRALVRHQGCSVLRDIVSAEKDVALPLIDDQSRWTFHFHDASAVELTTEPAECDESVWNRIVKHQPVDDRPKDADIALDIHRVLTWEYPYLRDSETPAKWTVSDLKYILQARQDESAALAVRWQAGRGTPRQTSQITAKPRFLSAGSDVKAGRRKVAFTNAEIGTIMHTVMQHLALDRNLDESEVKAQVAGLVSREILTEEQASQVNVKQIERFFASDLGERMKAAAKVYRELPFTMAIPLEELHLPTGNPAETADSKVLVQGVIDCIFEEGDGSLILLDFKTDGFAGETEEALETLTQRYREQIMLYTRAVEQIWRREIKESYLYFFQKNIAARVK